MPDTSPIFPLFLLLLFLFDNVFIDSEVQLSVSHITWELRFAEEETGSLDVLRLHEVRLVKIIPKGPNRGPLFLKSKKKI
jgi:hypothetical protein